VDVECGGKSLASGGMSAGRRQVLVLAMVGFVFFVGLGSGFLWGSASNPAPKPPQSIPIVAVGHLLTRNAPSYTTVFVNITIEVSSEVEATAHYEVKKCDDSEEYEMDLSTNYT